MVYAPPNTKGSLVELKSRYGNFIGGEWSPPRRASTSRT